MCLSRIVRTLAICLCLMSVACSSNTQIVINKNDKDKLLEMPDSIELKFAQGRTIWHYCIKKGEILLESVQTIPPAYLKEHPYIRVGEDIPKGLPKIIGFIYYGPYRLSPDKSHIVISLSSIDDRLHPTDLAIIRLDTSEIVFQTKNNNEWYGVSDIAWSADSKKFAVLNRLAERKHWPSDIFFSMFGHYLDHQTYFLSIYDLKGNSLVRAKIASELINGSGQIFWEDR